jgi:hypothetical protein
VSAPQYVLDFAGTMEAATEKAMAAGMSPEEFFNLLGTFVGYAAANDPRANSESVADAIGIVLLTASAVADERLGQCRGTVQ